MIEVRGVGKSYRGTSSLRVLQDVDLTVRDGEFMSFIGPSGCGKTTLLKMIDGLLPYDEGEILVKGRPVSGPGPERAVVFQQFALLPWLTVRENVGFGLELRGSRRAERDGIADELIQMVGLRGFADHFPRQLSGGMQQRVGLARALAVDPEILLMDEPFGAVDALTRNLLQIDLLRVWEQSRKTVIFVTHAMDEAVFLSDRVVIMATRPGRIAEVIDIDLPRPRNDETRTDPRFIELTAYVWSVLRTMLLEAGADPAEQEAVRQP